MTRKRFSRSNPTVPISWGEFIDKLTILEIKEKRLKLPSAVANVRRELKALTGAAPAPDPDLATLMAELKSVNETLWDIEDKIRAKEAAKCFDRAFIELARSIYIQNDKRAALKHRINVLMNSAIVEEKEYTRYG